MIKAIALDDEPLPLEILRTFCERIPEEISLLAAFSKVTEAKQFLETEKVDLIFLDIQMPFLSGLDFYRLFGSDKLLILTTAYSDFALEGFNLGAVDYLLKPFDFERFHQAVKKALRYKSAVVKTQTEGVLWIKSDAKQVRVNLSEILYIEAMSDYLRIFMEQGKPLVTRMTLKKMLEELDENFVRIHKSYIVRKDKITAKSTKEVQIGTVRLPVGSSIGSASELD